MPSNQAATRIWSFTDKQGETRTYEQSELTIDGEMQLFALINRSIITLNRNGFPFDRLTEVFPPSQTLPDGSEKAGDVNDINWAAAAELLSLAAPAVPALASEAAAAFLGIFMTDEHGNRNRTYDEEVAFLRRTIKTADLIEMIETFTTQNDIERLRGPLVRTLQTIFRLGATEQPSIEASTSSSQAATERPSTSGGTTRGRRSSRT